MFALRIIKRKPIISNAVWLLNIWSTLSIWHRIIYKFLYRYLSVLTVHSRECLTVAQRCFPSLNIKLMQFGINIDVFKITKPSYESAGGVTRLLAAGHDRTRDWHTLLLAFGNDDRFHLTLVCPWLTNEQIADYRNVALVRSPTMSRFLELYRDADFVAVPMKSNIFSGITVALEAVALGRPVLCSRTGGVPTYFGEDEIFYTPVDDAEAMRQTILSAGPEERYRKASAAQHRFIESDYSTRAVVRHYASLTRSLEVA
jgi:glycosyltransferase involved in cell wall biosynthesis